MATTNRKVRNFSDLDLLFNYHPFTRDVNRKYDVEAIKTSVRNLVLTKNYERPFHPEIGCTIHSLLFENFSPAVKLSAEITIRNVLERFEPRIRLLSVDVKDNTDTNSLEIDINFVIKNTELPITVTTTIGRLR